MAGLGELPEYSVQRVLPLTKGVVARTSEGMLGVLGHLVPVARGGSGCAAQRRLRRRMERLLWCQLHISSECPLELCVPEGGGSTDPEPCAGDV
jgi:hypothetical protein